MAGRVIAAAQRTRAPRPMKAAIEVTDNASKRLNSLLTSKPDAIGVRLGVKTRGCNGLSYTMDYATEKKSTDEVVTKDGVNILIEPQALMNVIGTQMDWVEDEMKSEFVFINPNAKSTCGCGESFNT